MITGPNGCGKTTLLLLASGILKPQQGHVEFNGSDVSVPSMKVNIGVSANGVSLPGFMTARELLYFHASQLNVNNQDKKIDSWCQRFNITSFLNVKVANLSLGNHKKLSLIMALLHEPKLLLLDEPTNGLDDQGLQVLDQVISEFSGQIVMASHDGNTDLMASMTVLPLASVLPI